MDHFLLLLSKFILSFSSTPPIEDKDIENKNVQYKDIEIVRVNHEESSEIPDFKTHEERILWVGCGCPHKSNYFPKNFTVQEKAEYIEEGLNWLKNHKKFFDELVLYYHEKKDCSKYLYWAMRGAEKGSGFCMSFLRYAYSTNDGVIQDQEESIKWCFLAAAKGIPEDKKMLNDFMKSNLVNSSLAFKNGKIKAKEWMERHPKVFLNPN